MKFRPLKAAAPDPSALAEEYREARKADAFRFGAEHIFVRSHLVVSYVAYDEVSRFFRRILAVPLKISCCGGVMEVQNIVLSDDERELAVVVLKDPRMVDTVVDCLRTRLPHAAYGKPEGGAAGCAAANS